MRKDKKSAAGKILNWFFRPLFKMRGEESYKEFIDNVFHITERDISDYVVIQDFSILGAHKVQRLGKSLFVRGTDVNRVKRGTIVTIRRDDKTPDQVEYEFTERNGSIPKIFNSTLTEWEKNSIFMSRLADTVLKRRRAVRNFRKP